MFPRINKQIGQLLPEETYQALVQEQNREDLIEQLSFLNGNYSTLLRNNLCDANFVSAQLDDYLNRFLSGNDAWFALAGNDWQTHAKPFIGGCVCMLLEKPSRFHKELYVDMCGAASRVSEKAMCMLYFVNTFEELYDLHEKTLSFFQITNKDIDKNVIFPPVILIVQDENSPLLDKNNLAKCDVPVFDALYCQDIRYERRVNGNWYEDVVDYSSWKKILHKITPLFFQAAVRLGMINQEILYAQAAFMDIALHSKLLPQEIWRTIGDYLFQYNLKDSLLELHNLQESKNDCEPDDEFRRCSVM